MPKIFSVFMLAVAAAVTVSCSGEFEKYVTSNKGILFSYGQGFAFTAIKPSGWQLDRATAASNDFNFLIAPTNAPGIAIYSYGIVIPKNTDGREQISNDIQYLYSAIRQSYPDAVLETVTNLYAIDRARDVKLFVINNANGQKNFFKVYSYVLWKRALGVLVYHAEDYRDFVFHFNTYEFVLNSVRYWGEDAAPLVKSLKQLAAQAAKRNLTN